MKSLGLGLLDVSKQTGLAAIVLLELFDEGGVASLEVVGPIDELLDKLEAEREAKVIATARSERPLQRIEVNLGALVDATVTITGTLV